jgi:acyl-CoA thioesterase FadM
VIRTEQKATLARARVTSVCVDPKSRQKVRVPDAFRDAVASFDAADRPD